MARHTLYAYVDGSDLDDVADEFGAKLREFVASDGWRLRRPTMVDQRRENDPTLGPENLPDWELGVNLELPDPGDEPRGWFADVERIARFLGTLHESHGRDFVIGIGDNASGRSEDLFFVDCGEPNLLRLRQIIGVKDEAE